MSILKIEDIAKTFDGIRAIDNLSFTFEKGKIISLIGPNGAGKTTLFNIISGFLSPDKGYVYYDHKDITGLAPYRIVNLGISRTFQDLKLFSKMTVLENILLGRHNQRGEGLWQALLRSKHLAREEEENKDKALDLLEFVGLCEKRDELAEDLSYGQQKLLVIARALAGDADLLLFDEPASGLQPDMVGKMLKVIKDLSARGKTVFLIEHDMSVVMRVSDRVIVLDSGEMIAEGSPQEIQQDPRVIEAYL